MMETRSQAMGVRVPVQWRLIGNALVLLRFVMVSAEMKKYEVLRHAMIQGHQVGMDALQLVRLSQDGTALVNHLHVLLFAETGLF